MKCRNWVKIVTKTFRAASVQSSIRFSRHFYIKSSYFSRPQLIPFQILQKTLKLLGIWSKTSRMAIRAAIVNHSIEFLGHFYIRNALVCWPISISSWVTEFFAGFHRFFPTVRRSASILVTPFFICQMKYRKFTHSPRIFNSFLQELPTLFKWLLRFCTIFAMK